VHKPSSNSILWRPGAEVQAVNGLVGKRLGANKRCAPTGRGLCAADTRRRTASVALPNLTPRVAPRHASPKHRAAACKALVHERFLELCAALRDAG